MKPPVQHSKIEHNSVLRNLNPLFAAGQAVGLKTASVRMIILTSYIMSLVILAGYSASLISSLAVERRHPPFRDLQGLLYDGSYKLGVVDKTSYMDIFKVRSRQTSD